MRTARSILQLLVLTAATAVASTSCLHSAATDVPTDVTVNVKVINNNFSDINVFADGPAQGRRRLGTVTGQMSASFKLPASYAAFGELQLVGIPIGGFGSARSGTMQVGPGETVVFTLQAELGLSSVRIEQP